MGITKENLNKRIGISKEKVINVIKSLNKEEIRAMIDEDNGAEVVCHFCNKKEKLSAEELEQIIVDKQKK